ncbi:manganese efflux pump MntP [Desertihabitans aurantiacus]|uniref:manganese efflux pump MntP n=1 Tax=Desertihabitans aurantiacus TaxID=2282477 RepID=UPI000DF7E905|nr:manganese efflux pump MntP family protein [Desertihabitans aurantiacus]
MSLLNLVVIAVGVSADAFAVSIAQGVQLRARIVRQALLVGLTFGVFQALMPLLGWYVGVQVGHYIEAVDHWIACALLVAVGAKMLWDGLRDGADDEDDRALSVQRLLVLAVATSVDALAIGISLALLGVDIWGAVVLIGVVTAVLSFGAVLLGHRVGLRFRRPAEVVGALVLMAIGVRILLDHTLLA